MISDTNNDIQEHSLTIVSRHELKISGVKQVLNFDDNNVALITVCGELVIEGSSLNIDALDLDRGITSITGNVDGVSYFNSQPAKKKRFRLGL